MPRPTIRLRLTLLYAGVFLLAGAALLTVSYVLVRNNLHAGDVGIGPGPVDDVRRAVQREVADDALHRLRLQYALALVAMTALVASMLPGRESLRRSGTRVRHLLSGRSTSR